MGEQGKPVRAEGRIGVGLGRDCADTGLGVRHHRADGEKATRHRHPDLAEPFATAFEIVPIATAFEVALKIKETGYLVAEPYSSADFRHGPSAVVGRGFPVVLIAPSGRTLDDVAELTELCRRRGAPVVAISDARAALGSADLQLPIPTGVPEWLSPLLSVIPGQLFAVSLARARGLDPDNPRGLSKVTETR